MFSAEGNNSIVGFAYGRVPLTVDMVWNLLIGAFEGGCPWMMVESVTYGEGLDRSSFTYSHEIPFAEGCSMVIRDCEDPSLKGELSLETIKAGLRKFQKVAPKHFKDWMQENDDAVTSSAFLEVVLFGEVVFC